MFSSRKYEHFVQVSSNQKHVFIMFAGVRCGQESISKQTWFILPATMVVLPAVKHAFRRVRNYDQPAVTRSKIGIVRHMFGVRSDCCTLKYISSIAFHFERFLMWINNQSEIFQLTYNLSCRDLIIFI